MEDDIFAQLASLVENKPKSNNLDASTNSGVTSSFSNSIFSDAAGSTSGFSYTSNDAEMFSQDDIVVPVIKPKKNTSAKKLVVVIDDDFSTLDLMKIYLQRDYEYVSFDNPKNAIFYLNANIPSLIFIDCYLNVMNTKRLLDIINTYKELAKVPIIYLAEPAEEAAIKDKLPERVSDIIPRPVKRADLQRILDTYIVASDETEDDIPISHDIIS